MDSSIVAAGWRFDNSYARLPEPLLAAALPVPVRSPRLVILNEPLAAALGLEAGILRDHGAPVFAGNELPPGAEPIAQAYAGHQFGHFTNLGDGPTSSSRGPAAPAIPAAATAGRPSGRCCGST